MAIGINQSREEGQLTLPRGVPDPARYLCPGGLLAVEALHVQINEISSLI
jgi:hypothetical protein